MKRVIILSVVAALVFLLGLAILLNREGSIAQRPGGATGAGAGMPATGRAGVAAGSAAAPAGQASSGERGTATGHSRSASAAGSSSRRARGWSSGEGTSATNSAALQSNPSVMKQRAMKQLFAASMRGSTRAIWEALKESGITLSYEDYLQYLKKTKSLGFSVDRVEGAWDQLLQFWARKDPAAALEWARSYQLDAGYTGPDEIFYRMISAWGSVDPAAAIAYARGIPGLATTARGQEAVKYLEESASRVDRLPLLLTSTSPLTPEQKRELMSAVSYLYALPDEKVAVTAKWLIANRASIEPSMWEQAMGTLASRMNDVPVFDLVALTQSLTTNPGSRNIRSGLISSIASRDPQTAMSLAGDVDSDRIAVLQQWSQNNPADALQWVLNLPDQRTSTPYLTVVTRNIDRLMRVPQIEGMAFPSTETILQTVDILRAAGIPAYNEACEWAARTMLATDPNRAFELAARSSSPGALDRLLGEWARSDPAATLAWVNSRNDSAAYAAAVKSVFPEVVRRDLDTAIAWSRQLQDRTLWLSTVKELLPLTPYERWNEVLGSSPAALKAPDVAGAALSGAIQLAYNDFEGSCIAVDEVMIRMGLGETDSERQANWQQQPAEVRAAFDHAQQGFVGQMSYNEPQTALAWAEQWSWAYPPDSAAVRSLQSAFQRWSSSSPDKAMAWLNASRFTEEQRQAIVKQQTFSTPVINVTPTGSVHPITTRPANSGR